MIDAIMVSAELGRELAAFELWEVGKLTVSVLEPMAAVLDATGGPSIQYLLSLSLLA